MIKFFLLIALTLFTVYALDTTLEVSVEKGKPSVGSFMPERLFGEVSFAVEGTFDKTLILCLQAGDLALPVMSKYGDCTVSLELVPGGTTSTTGRVSTGVSTGVSTSGSSTGGSSTGGSSTTGGLRMRRSVVAGGNAARVVSTTLTAALRNVKYNWGVYFKTEPGKDATDKQDFKIKVSGLQCGAGKTGPKCAYPVKDIADNGTTATFTAGMDYYFTVAATQANTLTLTSDEEFTMKARYAASPFGGIADYSGTGKELVVPSPSVGTWYVVLTSAATVKTTVKYAAQPCPKGFAGAECKLAVSLLNGTSYNKTKVTVGEVVMFSVEGDLNTLLISARNAKKENTAQPKIYASFNRSPQFNGKDIDMKTVDISGCNVEVCKNLNQINLRSGVTQFQAEKGTWYVAVQAQVAGDMYVWSNSICPNNCSSHGTCKTSGDDYGVCECEPSANSDLLCTGTDFLVEYIILIVIASLVAISAIIGLVAWAYMKSKHQGYEPV